jgi:FMN phosphatase YigB (HAD superfamily)
MKARCNFRSRKTSGRNGKNYVLFIDVDGTLVVCDPLFVRARENFVFLMSSLGFDAEAARQMVQDVDLKNARAVGFERDRFPASMVEAYRELCKKFTPDATPEPRVIELCTDIGNSPFFQTPQVFANVLPALERASEYFLLVAVTMGNREVQEHKIYQAGFGGLFDELIITPNDNKPECVREAIHDMNVDPSLSAFIGNSLRSDGACLTETNFIHLPLEAGWAFDNHALPANTGFEAITATSWREVEERGIARLIRRREYKQSAKRRRKSAEQA